MPIVDSIAVDHRDYSHIELHKFLLVDIWSNKYTATQLATEWSETADRFRQMGHCYLWKCSSLGSNDSDAVSVNNIHTHTHIIRTCVFIVDGAQIKKKIICFGVVKISVMTMALAQNTQDK